MILKKLILKWIWAGFFEVFYAKLMTNLEKSSPESFGTAKKRQRWAGLAAQVANVGPMVAQWGPQYR